MADLNTLEKIVQNPALLEKQMVQTIEMGMTIITTYGLKVIGAVAILVIGWTIAGVVHRTIMKAGTRSHKVDITIFTFTASVVKYAILAFTLIATLANFGVETTSFVAVLGATGLAIGLALQGTLSNVAAGMMLILLRPFRVGDFVETAKTSGTVTEMSLFTTELATLENVRIVIPNNMIWADVIKNFTGNLTRRTDLIVGISYEDNIDAAITAINTVIEAEARVIKDPAPVVAVRALADSAVNLLVRYWTTREDVFEVQLALNKAIKEKFDQEGITIPFPQSVVRHINVNAPQGGNVRTE
jgi:small conductance mechanosensitive channel